MSGTLRPYSIEEPEGRLDGEGRLFLPNDQDAGASPGGGMEDGTTTGTTGRILPPGAHFPVDDPF